MRDYRLFLKDIISAMECIEKFVEDMSLDQFVSDLKTSSAVIRQFEILGEATKHIPDQLKNRYPEIPWKRMAGMRDRLIHAYFGISHRLVWDAIKIEIPSLKPKLQQMLANLEREEK
jgi:uncharacterized protein with HEPN domain